MNDNNMKKKVLGMHMTAPPTWIKCPECDEEYACTIHEGSHASDCSCPAIEVWAEHGHCPYDDPVTQEICDFVAANPMDFADEYE